MIRPCYYQQNTSLQLEVIQETGAVVDFRATQTVGTHLNSVRIVARHAVQANQPNGDHKQEGHTKWI
tara:strand:+ start:181 stop:381 length:201 start_codon:yes stop_codon:yes gene_type:complete